MSYTSSKTNWTSTDGVTYNDLNRIEKNIAALKELNYYTYTELTTLINNDSLIAGKQYILRDYATTYIQPGTDVLKVMDTEPLILMANTDSSFCTLCASILYESDIIHYDFNNKVCEDGNTSRPGFITRRISPKMNSNIDCPLDWRSMLWARWCPSATSYRDNGTVKDYLIWESGAAVSGAVYKDGDSLYLAISAAVPSDSTDYNVFAIIYEDISVGRLLKDTKITSNVTLIKGALSECETFGGGCQNIVVSGFSETLANNVFGYNCSNIIMANNCYNNTICSNLENISLGNGCHDNLLFENCSDNSMDSQCYDNVYLAGSANNKLGSKCRFNIIGANCYNNVFLNNCYGNVLGNGCSSNTLFPSCSYVTFGNNKNNLIIKCLINKNISSIVNLTGKTYANIIERRADAIFVYRYINSSNVIVFNTIP